MPSSGYNLSNSGNHFEHTFGSIGHTGAEIWPVKGLRKNWLKDEAANYDANHLLLSFNRRYLGNRWSSLNSKLNL